ncbi:MAG TPA: formyltetrahydrofolate deformylase [Deinococcales bacterium]|nr:formyltetrahydrofolate deformylase [Deinococcales bacterium]
MPGVTTAGQQDIARLLINCPDRPGIVAAVSGALRDLGANIISSAQHTTDPSGGQFFMRQAFQLPNLHERRAELQAEVASVAAEFEMNYRISNAADPKRVAVLVSKYDHCLLDLLWRWRRQELPMDLVGVYSNHETLRGDADSFDVPFTCVPVTPGEKDRAERALLDQLRGKVDLVVLARYMQILSAGFLEELGVPVINIHHSFLPAFVGANPYRSALERGVKIIGATAHYVTAELDAGPIIEQDVARVSHSDGLSDLMALGRDIERTVLSRAVRWHVEDRVLVFGNRTVVFN